MALKPYVLINFLVESAFVPCRYIKSCLAAVEITDREVEAGNDDYGIKV